MKNGILIIVICMSACAWTPKDEAWKLSLEIPNPPGLDGNCLPVAQALKEKYGGEITVISRLDGPDHAVLVIKDKWVLDNGTVGYKAHWDDLIAEGWKFKYRWKP